jgi:hypothetical protein
MIQINQLIPTIPHMNGRSRLKSRKIKEEYYLKDNASR